MKIWERTQLDLYNQADPSNLPHFMPMEYCTEFELLHPSPVIIYQENATADRNGGLISNLQISTLLSIRKFPDDSREKPISWVVIA